MTGVEKITVWKCLVLGMKKINFFNHSWGIALFIGRFFGGSDHPNYGQFLVSDPKKTIFTPPSWLLLLFGPCSICWWELLQDGFRIMASTTAGSKRHLSLWIPALGQWALVAGFLRTEKSHGALVVILVLLFLIFRTIQQFRNVDRLATRLLYPYLIWVCFATFLNGYCFSWFFVIHIKSNINRLSKSIFTGTLVGFIFLFFSGWIFTTI